VVNPRANFTPAAPATQATEPVKTTEQNHVPAESSVAFGAEAPASPAAPVAQPAAETRPIDPLDDHPAHVRAAVNAVGGLGTPEGEEVFAALTGLKGKKRAPSSGGKKKADEPKQAEAPVEAPKQAEPALPFGSGPAAPESKPAAPAPKEATVPEANLSAAPAAQTAPGGSVNLSAALAAALKG